MQDRHVTRRRLQAPDYATAPTALAKNQIVQQAATAMLAQANVSQDMVSYLLKQYIK